jgi:hypothetical protein
MPDDANLVFTQERAFVIPTNQTKLQAEFSPFIANIFFIYDILVKVNKAIEDLLKSSGLHTVITSDSSENKSFPLKTQKRD